MSKLKTRILDLGNYNIKLEDFSFISTFADLDAADQSEENILELQNHKYRMEFEGSFDAEFNKAKKDYVPNLLWGLDKSGAVDGDKYRLILGLPLTNLGHSEKLVEDLKGKSFTFTTSSTKTITIEEVYVVGEGISSYYVLPASIREEDLVIVDIGGRTTNVVEYSKKRVKQTDTVNMGMIDFYDKIKVKFNNEEGESIETHNVKHLIEKNIVPQYQSVENEFVNELMRRISVKFKLNLGKKIIFTGGGSITLKGAIIRFNNKFLFIDDPLFSNVKGNLKLAKAKGWL